MKAQYDIQPTSRFDLLISELCEEIDYWKGRAKDAEERADNVQRQYSETLTRDIKHGEKMMGMLLMATINGNLRPSSEIEQSTVG